MRTVIFLLGLCAGFSAWAADNVQAFILHSYSQEYPWTKRQHEGFMQELQAGSTFTFQASVEYLDTKRVAYNPAYAAHIAADLARKYQGYKPAFIYVSDDNALSFALAHLGKIFPDVPVFFSGVNNYEIRTHLNPEQTTGVFERKEIIPNLALIKRLAPRTRDILLVGDESETAAMINQEIKAGLRKFPDIQASFLSSSRIDRLTKTLAERKERIIILTTLGAMKNSAGQNISPEQTLSAINQAGQFSIFSMEDAYLYPGVLGGYVTSGKQQGKTAAQLVKHYLAGSPMKQIAPVETSPNEYLFHAPTMQQAGLILPADIAQLAKLLNPLPTYYEAHRKWILLALYGLIFVTIFLLAVYLVVLRQKNRQIASHSAALLKSESQLKEAQEVARLGSWNLDLATGRAVWSDQEYHVLGYTPGSVEASAENFMNAVHPDDRPAVIAEMQRVMDAHESRPYGIEHRVIGPAGERIVEQKGRVTFGKNNLPVSMLGTTMDITERKRAEEAVRQLNEELEQRVTERTLQLAAAKDDAERANYAKSEFLSRMSHELRTPMNAILGFGQLLEYDKALSAVHRENVQEIVKAGHHLLQLINEVLDLARIESGHIDLSLEPVEVCPVIHECLNLVAAIANKRDIKISHSKLEGAAVRADRMRLKQALLNLISNAIKFNRDSGSVQIDVRQAGTDRLRIVVSDTGQGIAAQHLRELFQPFNRLNAEASGVEGTGIGLTITRSIVEMMGGTVEVESKVGIGSTFWIELPRESLPDAARPGKRTATAGSTPEGQSHTNETCTVLYIEDNPANLKLVAQILGLHPHIHLITAHTALLGIELALAHHPELILLDINMPGMSGYQVLEVLKAEASLKTIPVVAVTANAMAHDIERGKAAGFADYLIKPLDIPRFTTVVDNLLAINNHQK